MRITRMAKLPDMTKLSAKDQEALAALLAKAGTSIAALSTNGKVSPLSDPDYVAKCIALRPELEKYCVDRGVTLGHVFTASDKPRKVYKDPATGKVYESKGKKPEWLKGNEDKYEVRSN
jgi:hypothetical protein